MQKKVVSYQVAFATGLIPTLSHPGAEVINLDVNPAFINISILTTAGPVIPVQMFLQVVQSNQAFTVPDGVIPIHLKTVNIPSLGLLPYHIFELKNYEELVGSSSAMAQMLTDKGFGGMSVSGDKMKSTRSSEDEQAEREANRQF